MAYTSNLPKDEEKRLAQERVEKTFAKIYSGVVSLFDKDELPAFLAFAAKLHHFDTYNLILIYQQRPSSTFVAPYKTWLRISSNHWHDPSRPVFFSSQKGQGIGIFAPYILKKKVDATDLRSASISTRIKFYLDYHVVYVFDKEQTKGIPAPAMDWDISKSKVDAEAAFHAFMTVAPFDVFFSTEQDALKGNFVFIESGPDAKQRDTLMLNGRYRFDYVACCNFIVRIFVAHSLEKMLEFKGSPDEAEKITECVSFVIASYFGLDNQAYTFFFAKSWASDTKRMLEILNTIRQVSHQLIENIEAEMIDFKNQFGPQEDIYAFSDDIYEFENLSIFDV